MFGGKSCEHNVSIVTGVQALHGIPRGIRAVPIYIDELGIWHTGKEYADISWYQSKRVKEGKEVHLRPSSPYLYTHNGKKVCKIDCCLLCNHGANGEDGSLQGLLQLSGIPYTGSDVAASAAGMNKHMMKRLFAAAGLPILPYVCMSGEQYVYDSYAAIEAIKKELTFPLIVKPCRAGSSIGIGIAHDYNELFAAIRVALEWDTDVIVERALTDFEEYNCAVLCGEASEVEKPIGWKDFLTYEDKYLSKSEGTGREFPADIDDALRQQIRDAAVKAYRAVEADGVARVDFLYKDGELYVNEINTLPGSLSAYFYEGGETYVIEKLIARAVERTERRKKLHYVFRPFRGEGKGRRK